MMRFSVMFFSAASEADVQDTYRTVLAAARLADEGGLTAVWTPERHFDDFGGGFPTRRSPTPPSPRSPRGCNCGPEA
ncbi:LLM class flavin-dependent oxidoreductase [Streptomyces sp. M19]